MADYVNPQTCEVAISVNTRTDPWIQITRDLSLAWSVIPLVYRKWVVDHIEEMTQAEKDAVDTAMREQMRDDVIQQVDDLENILRSFMLMVLDEFNNHSQKVNAILTAVDTANNFAEVKANYAAITDLPVRTAAQLRSAIRSKLGT